MTSRGTRYWNSGSIPLIGPDILGDIIATLADIAIVISADAEILSVLANPIHQGYADLHRWERSDLRNFLTVESVPKFERALANHLNSPSAARPVELNHHDPDNRREFLINYTLHRIGPDNSILMLGRDLRPIAEMQQQLVKAQIALERDYEAQRQHDALFQVLLGHVFEAIVFVSVATGQITEINEAAAALMGRPREALANRPFTAEIEGRDRAALLADLVGAAARPTGTGAGMAVPVEGGVALTLARTGRAIRAHPVLFRAAGEQVILCRLQPVDGAGEVRAGPADERAQDLAGLFDLGADAIVTTDGEGVIHLANEAFLNLTDGTDLRSAVGRPLSDFLARGGVDLRVLLDGATQAGRVRLYATRVVSEYGSQRPVTIAATHLTGRGRSSYAFVMRDPGLATTAGETAGMPLATARPVDELVGGTSMKDIVAQTADVVERMCIETAIEMTGNNRVAAAGILGVSRQSLYVKLRKYGLIDRESDGQTGEVST